MIMNRPKRKNTCSVEGCQNPRFFLSPTDDALARKIWVDRIGDCALKRNFSICPSHFHKSCFTEKEGMKKYKKGEKEPEKILSLKRGSLPTLFLPKFKVRNEEESLQYSNHQNMKLSKGEEALTRVDLQAPVMRTSLIENVCSVSGCKNTSENTTMHTFPSRNEVYNIWFERTKNPKFQLSSVWCTLWKYRICDIHFSAHCRTEGVKLKDNSLPSLHLPDMHDESEEASLLNFAPNSKLTRRRKRCSAPDCKTDSMMNPDLHFFRFPHPFRDSQTERHQLWRKIIWLADGDTAHFLCERHFAKHDVIDGRLRVGANPSYPTGYLNPVTNNYSPIVEYELQSGHESAEEKPYHEKNIKDPNQNVATDDQIPTSSMEEKFIVESINTGEHAIPAHIVFDLALKYVDHFSLASAEQTKFLKRCQDFAKRSGDIMEYLWKDD